MKTSHPFALSTRRAFLATSTAALAAPAFLPSHARGQGPNDKLNLAFIGMGGQMQGLVRQMANMGHRLAAFCDVDAAQLASSKETHKANAASTAIYEDYRVLFEKEKSIDAVIVATPDHWHFPIVAAAMQLGKHVYCEKPLTHTIQEARTLRMMSRQLKVTTQMGNQGSSSSNLRRSMELIKAGLFGQITDVIVWHPKGGWPGNTPNLDQADPIPDGLAWDFWCGPSNVRPYKQGLYHPARWRQWYEYGNGFIGDFCCHAFNLPLRALELDYPSTIEFTATGLGLDCVPESYHMQYKFPARESRGPVTIHVYNGGRYPENGELDAVVGTFGKLPRVGCLLIGEKGQLSAGLWNNECYVKLNDDAKFIGEAKHEAARAIPQSIPRSPGQMKEWEQAILNGTDTFANFEHGGHLTEIGLAGNVALRMQRNITWDGPNMRVPDSPEADALITKANRTHWL